MKPKFFETANEKQYMSDEFNYIFNKNNGYTMLWGKTPDEDPEVAPFPVILDFEITERCEGIGNYGPCPFCYKSNTPNKGKVTSFEEAKAVIDKMPPMLTQIAFGTDAKLKSNPDWYEIFKYARSKGIIPNVTVADIDDETAKKLASVCGAVAVSRYHDKDICYNSVKRLTDAGITQCNIHQLVSVESLPQIYELIEDVQKDPRLAKLNAVVFLSLKRKGRGETFHSVSKEEFEGIVNKCLELGIRFGFDSCSASRVIRAVEGTDKEYLKTYCEPCESGIQSFYINAYGEAFPCSFTEGTKGWEKGIDVISCKDFVEDVWYNPRTHNFRELLLMNCRNCPIYNV